MKGKKCLSVIGNKVVGIIASDLFKEQLKKVVIKKTLNATIGVVMSKVASDMIAHNLNNVMTEEKNEQKEVCICNYGRYKDGKLI